MKILFLGDVHGEWAAMNIVIAKAITKHPDITHIIQVGDFGMGWKGKEDRRYFKWIKKFHVDVPDHLPIHWCDGNHDRHDLLARDGNTGSSLENQGKIIYQPRGSVLEIEEFSILFFGGASSIDRDRRTEGKDWWPEECIQYGQIQKALEYDGKIDAIVSHDHPASVPYSYKRYNSICGQGDRTALEALKNKFNPEYWFFGHHHHEADGILPGGMEWYCCPIIEQGLPYLYTIWDGYNVTKEWY
jgi:predicted phosphodiesterase